MSKDKCFPPNPSTDSVIHTYPPALQTPDWDLSDTPMPLFKIPFSSWRLKSWLLALSFLFPLTGRFGMLLCEAWTHVNSLILFQISIPAFSVTLIKKTKTALLVPNALIIATVTDRVSTRGHPALSCSGAHCLRGLLPSTKTLNHKYHELGVTLED